MMSEDQHGSKKSLMLKEEKTKREQCMSGV